MDPHKAMYYVSAVFGIVGIGLAFVLHLAGRRTAGECKMDAIAAKFGPFPKWAENKWYVDELYDLIVRYPLLAFSHLFHWIDKLIVDGALVNGLGALPKTLGALVRPSQGGSLHGYAVGMAGGLAVLLIVALIALAGGVV
jgi:NADH-quinone oxidoreductase subunit L